VRGLSPYPAAWTILNEKTYKIYEVSVMDKAPGTPGSITIEIGDITIAAGQNAIRIHNLQAEGKKRMNAKEFLRGNTI
jgi:methionyl-tRNA formyltransferase